MGSRVAIGELAAVVKEAVKPEEGVVYHHYSLPAFDGGKAPEVVDGSAIRSNKLAVLPGVILMNKLNVRFRRVWPIVECWENSVASTEFIPLKPAKVDYWYLYYQLISPSLTSQLERMRTGTSNSHQRIDQAAFLNYEIDLPDAATQQRIGAFLRLLDAKIDVNNRINDYLAVLKNSCFLQLYSRAETNELREITSRYKKRVQARELPVFSAIKTGELIYSESYFTKRVYSESISNYIVVPKMAFAYNPARANIGSLGLNKFENAGCVSPAYVVFTVNNGYEHYLDCLLKTAAFRKSVEIRSSGSVRQSLCFEDFQQIELPIPSQDLVDKFNDDIRPLREASDFLNVENAYLAETRDALLPKLMSGEIDVSQVDITQLNNHLCDC